MASDRKNTHKGNGGAYARATAISRFLKRVEGIQTTNNACRGTEGVRVHQDIGSAFVTLSVFLGEDAEKAAAEWAGEIADKLRTAGYQVERNGRALAITHDTWIAQDMIRVALGRCLFTGREAIASDIALINAAPHTIEALRGAGILMDGTLRLTEFGEQVRVFVLAENKKKDQAEKRRIKARGW
jgi:hypothetical protein